MVSFSLKQVVEETPGIFAFSLLCMKVAVADVLHEKRKHVLVLILLANDCTSSLAL